MTKEAAIQALAEEIADATFGGCYTSKELAVWLYNKGYRLMPVFPLTSQEIAACEELEESLIPPFRTHSVNVAGKVRTRLVLKLIALAKHYPVEEKKEGE